MNCIELSVWPPYRKTSADFDRLQFTAFYNTRQTKFCSDVRKYATQNKQHLISK